MAHFRDGFLQDVWDPHLFQNMEQDHVRDNGYYQVPLGAYIILTIVIGGSSISTKDILSNKINHTVDT